jgi:hypothetical protein
MPHSCTSTTLSLMTLLLLSAYQMVPSSLLLF